MSVNVFLLLGMGAAIGCISGLFGVGGGFLMTPFLIFIGVPPSVAVATGINQIVASSFSGAIAQFRRGNVDIKMGVLLLAGGIAGSFIGVQMVGFLKTLGQIDLIIKLCYVLTLGLIGSLMFVESTRSIFKRRRSGAAALVRGPGRHTWMHGLPFKTRFRKSRLYISALLPIILGFIVGIIIAIMGISSIIMVPIMIYFLGMPTQVAIGTSLFQIMFVSANTTILQATVNQTVDIVLALLLLCGSTLGAQVGIRLGGKLRSEQLRILLAILVLIVTFNLVNGLVSTPLELFSIGAGR